MRKPNFFIVGAPKSGTTAISEYLRRHKKIFLSWPKEPHFFAEDFVRYRAIKTPEEYMAMFSKVNDTHRAVGEASVWYLYSTVAMKNIHAFNKDAKILAMLRNPVEFVHSLHFQLLFNLYEDQDDLETAWSLQEQRREGLGVPPNCVEEKFLQYAEAGSFGAQIARVFEVFPRDQVKVVLFDDFSKSPKDVYEDTLRFLEVPSDGRTEFPRINESKVNRLQWLGSIIHHPPFPLNKIEQGVKKCLHSVGIRRVKLWEKLRGLNTRNTAKPRLSANFRSRLTEAFRDDIQRLSELIERDLSDWTALRQD